MMRLFRIILIFVLIFAGSCSNYTKRMWSTKYYDEIFQYFLISHGGNFVTFLGDEYHYVFSDQYGILKRLLSFENRDELVINTDKTKITIDRGNNLRGKLVIETLGSELPVDQARFLRFLGFRKQPENYALEIEIRGTRYVNNVQFRGNFLKLSLPYRIRIYQSGSQKENVVLKTIATPFTLVADLVASIGKIILLPFTY